MSFNSKIEMDEYDETMRHGKPQKRERGRKLELQPLFFFCVAYNGRQKM